MVNLNKDFIFKRSFGFHCIVTKGALMLPFKWKILLGPGCQTHVILSDVSGNGINLCSAFVAFGTEILVMRTSTSLCELKNRIFSCIYKKISIIWLIGLAMKIGFAN